MVGARLRFGMSSVCGVQHCSHEVTTRHWLQNHGIWPRGMSLQFYIVWDRKQVARSPFSNLPKSALLCSRRLPWPLTAEQGLPDNLHMPFLNIHLYILCLLLIYTMAHLSHAQQVFIAAAAFGAVSAVVAAANEDKGLQPQHTSAQWGKDWVEELLTGHVDHRYNNLSMHKHLFEWLVMSLSMCSMLRDTQWVSKEE